MDICCGGRVGVLARMERCRRGAVGTGRRDEAFSHRAAGAAIAAPEVAGICGGDGDVWAGDCMGTQVAGADDERRVARVDAKRLWLPGEARERVDAARADRKPFL